MFLTGISVETQISRMEESGVGENVLNSIERDGIMNGYDLDFIKNVVFRSNKPIGACEGSRQN